MGMTISTVGNGYPPVELPNDRRNYTSAGQATKTEARQTPVDIDSTAADLEKITLAFNKKLRFVVDKDLKEVIVKVIDPDTDKVIKEIPPEELQRLHLKIKEMIGLLFDERA